MSTPAFAIVFDWDDVIFNTRLLKQLRDRRLSKAGHLEELVRNTARAAASHRDGYTPELHAKLLARHVTAKAATLADLIYSAFGSRPERLVLPDARRMLNTLPR